MFEGSRARAHAVSAALKQLEVADLYALSSADLKALRRQLKRWEYITETEGRDRQAWPRVRHALSVLVHGPSFRPL